MPAVQCASCASTGTAASPLKKCAGCHMVSYCSRDCQRTNWRQHKPACTAAAGAVVSANDTAYTYWNNSAHLDPAAVALAETLRLDFPNGSRGLKSGITYPLRRLTATGRDTPTNLHLLFGTSSRIDGHDRVRRHVLLHPPPGSPAHLMYAALDENCPFWTPRAPDEEEQRQIREVREMQARIRAVAGEGKEVESRHMMEVLGGFSGDWAAMLPVYEEAANCLDQGVRAA